MCYPAHPVYYTPVMPFENWALWSIAADQRPQLDRSARRLSPSLLIKKSAQYSERFCHSHHTHERHVGSHETLEVAVLRI
jgi:hypothetical protein